MCRQGALEPSNAFIKAGEHVTERLVGSTTIRHHIVRKKKSSAPVGQANSLKSGFKMTIQVQAAVDATT